MTETSAPPLIDQVARDRALDPAGSFIVQAPAGSGKTELLTQRYLRLLSLVEHPEQILALTFTRKAANEMRQRIVQALQQAHTQPRPTQSNAARTWDLARAVLTADQQHGWQLPIHPARLRIQTLDSLNAQLAHRLPVLARMGAEFEITTEPQSLYEAACIRLLLQLGSQDDCAPALEVLLLHLANRIPECIAMLSELLARRDHWLPVLIPQRQSIDLRARIEATLQAVIERQLSELHAAIPKALHHELVRLFAFAAANKYQADTTHADASVWRECATLTALPAVTAAALPQWLQLCTVLCTSAGTFRQRLDVRGGFPPQAKAEKAALQQLLQRLQAEPGLSECFAQLRSLPAAQFTDAQWTIVQALLQLLPRAVSELMLEFQARGQVDYVELSLRALQALGTPDKPTDIAYALDAKLQHILIDEFQDTSLTQMTLLQMLTAAWSPQDGRTVFCVGDPMQSIYRFRQAEVGLFLALQSAAAQRYLPQIVLQPLRLQTNFRSTHAVLSWVNACFATVFPAQNDSEMGAVQYSPSTVQPNLTATSAPQPGVRLHVGIGRSAPQEAAAICALVEQALQLPENKRIAILVSNRSHADWIARALKQAGIVFNAVDIERLQDRPVVQDLISLTRAMVHLGDRTAWLACLRAPWCGLTLADLHRLVASFPTHTVWSLLQDTALVSQLSAEGIQRVQRFTTVLAAALAERGRFALRDWVERCWLALFGPATLQAHAELEDANAYFKRLDEIEQAGDLQDVTLLETQLNALFAPQYHVQDADAFAAPRVEMMTIHKSKGLEFDVVILPALHRSGGTERKQLLRWTHLLGLSLQGVPVSGLIVAPPAAKGTDQDAIYEWLRLLDQQRTQLELGRVLYVAMTRAKRALHLFASAQPDPKAPAEAVLPPRTGTLLKLLWPQLQTEFVAALQVQQVSTQVAQQRAPVALRRLPLHWQPVMPSAVLPAVTPLPLQVELERPEFDWVGEISRHVGTVVHAELAYLLVQPQDIRLRWQVDARQAIITLQLSELGVPEKLREAACQRVITAVRSTLMDARGRWILGLDVTHTDVSAELALSGIMSINGTKTVVNGVIDCSFIDNSGTRWIIDFKTSAHAGGGQEDFLNSEVMRYRPQLARYAALMAAYQTDLPIKTALYFPLLSAWRVVDAYP